MWYSAIGYLVTVILGLIVSFITGAEDPHNVNEDLLSPPITNFLQKLPRRIKEVLNVPLKVQQNGVTAISKGLVNVALDVSSEKFTQTLRIEATVTGENEKFRKISLPV